MVYDSTVKFKSSEHNRSNLDSCHVFLWNKPVEEYVQVRVTAKTEIPWVKYTIKETDFRIKTATLTTPVPIDLTNGVRGIQITSKLHENFTGEILSNDYTDNKDGTFTYQCQDMSREFQGKMGLIIKGDINKYRVLQTLLTREGIGIGDKITASTKKNWKVALSGLRPLELYNQKLWANPAGGNMLANKEKLIIRNKSYMEAIRSICMASGAIDVYFNNAGTLQLEPISLDDWQHTGLWLGTEEIAESKFSFDTTNVITGVVVGPVDDTKSGKYYSGKALTNGLDLTAFFGSQDAYVDNPNKQNTNTNKNAAKGTAKAKNNTAKVNNKGNPYGTKAKKIWIGADGGSGGFAREIVSLLEKNGWHCHYSGEGAGVHNADYENVTSDYQILAIVDNGFCCTTIKEAYEGYCAPTLKRKNVTVMFMFDSRDWNEGMRPFKYGNFGNHVFHTAWDDSSGYCTSMHATNFFKKHNATYCCHPTAQGIVEQFLAGGYFKWKGVK